MNTQILTKMSQFDKARENLAKHVAESKRMFLDVRIAKNRPFGSYWVEGSNSYHLVTFSKLPNGAGKTVCGCIASVVCRHQAAAVDIHTNRVLDEAAKKEQLNRVQDVLDAAVECPQCEKFVWNSQMVGHVCSTCHNINNAIRNGDYVICDKCGRGVPKGDVDYKGLCTRCAVKSYIKKGA